ncbi:MAG: putative metal-binding motif-containing protein [Myxococcaceae bacterium]|nr:putative metal-binding motif-containing protein [Myxococcaceae bacterium]
MTLTLTIGGGISNGGFHLTSQGVGTFVAGTGTRLQGSGISHSSPRGASAGSVTYSIQWTAPMTPGGADFEAGIIGGNGDGRSSGDRANFVRLSLVWGCAGQTFYLDNDRDGHGNNFGGVRLRCGPAAGLSTTNTDCDDNDERVYPTATEACNGRDDNCNMQIDEGLNSTTTWPDLDGDGYGNPAGPTVMGCSTMRRAANPDDCDDTDALAKPGGIEVCNGKDDDCDMQRDEGVRVRCGIGWCARFGPTCDPLLCTVGEPRTEECNAFDDDCDGVADNGPVCPAGQTCFEGECYGTDQVPASDAGSGGGAGSEGGGNESPGGNGCSAAPALLVWASTLMLLRARRVRVRQRLMGRA